MKKIAITIFVKTPELSPCKTRLAADIGQEAALKFYTESIAVTQKLLQETIHSEFYIDHYFAVAEEDGLDSPHWGAFHRIAQGTGELGARLSKVYEELIQKYDAVIFIGADCPHIKKEVILACVDHFSSGEEEFVLGKSSDGGFYIFGGSSRLFSDIWTNVDYSQPDTADSLTKSLYKMGKVKFLEESFDIDLLSDLQKYEYIDLNKLNETQVQFIDWVKSEFLKIDKI
jgi:uncharacterized protein